MESPKTLQGKQNITKDRFHELPSVTVNNVDFPGQHKIQIFLLACPMIEKKQIKLKVATAISNYDAT